MDIVVTLCFSFVSCDDYQGWQFAKMNRSGKINFQHLFHYPPIKYPNKICLRCVVHSALYFFICVCQNRDAFHAGIKITFCQSCAKNVPAVPSSALLLWCICIFSFILFHLRVVVFCLHYQLMYASNTPRDMCTRSAFTYVCLFGTCTWYLECHWKLFERVQ